MTTSPGPAAGSGEPASARPEATAHHHHSGDCCSDHGHAHASPASLPLDPTALVSARGLYVTRGGRTILSGIDLDIHPGEIVTLIGPNGSGKTTLVRALLGLEATDRGTIRRTPGLSIGYVPQRFSLDSALPMTVERFLALGNGSRALRIAETLAEVGASRVRQTQMGNLSGGELQRVLLARALLNDPALLVLDEPARGVDYVGEAELYALIGRLRDTRNLGVVLVSHDLHVVMAQSDRVICINHHICCSGVPETVAQHPEYARLFGPETARSFGVYHHHHDHRHDLAGEPASAPVPVVEPPAGHGGSA
jgi:zinc transport system ATP-binding protein